jgi:hypothetical protein
MLKEDTNGIADNDSNKYGWKRRRELREAPDSRAEIAEEGVSKTIKFRERSRNDVIYS